MCNLPVEALLDVDRVVFRVLEVLYEVVNAPNAVVVRRALLQILLQVVQLHMMILQLRSQLGLALLESDNASFAMNIEEQPDFLEVAFAE